MEWKLNQSQSIFTCFIFVPIHPYPVLLSSLTDPTEETLWFKPSDKTQFNQENVQKNVTSSNII